MTSSRIAVILLEIGEPITSNGIKSFLFNVYKDRNRNCAFCPLGRNLSSFILSYCGFKNNIIRKYEKIVEKQSLTKAIQRTKTLLHSELEGESEDYKVFSVLRYNNDKISHISDEINSFNPDNIVLIPLYPHFSLTRTRSFLQHWNSFYKKGISAESSASICCFPEESHYIAACIDTIKKEIVNCDNKPHLIFSAEDIFMGGRKKNNPLYYQCDKTVSRIINALGYRDNEYSQCYGLKGSKKIEQALLEQGGKNKDVIVFPLVNTCKQIETEIELKEILKNIAVDAGCNSYTVCNPVGDHPEFIKCLAEIAKNHKDKKGLFSVKSASCIECAEKNKYCCQRLPDIIKGIDYSGCPACKLLKKLGI